MGTGFRVYVDGAFRESSQTMGIGWVRYKPNGTFLDEGSKRVTFSIKSSNTAEALAVRIGLKKLSRKTGGTVFTDLQFAMDGAEGRLPDVGQHRSIFAEIRRAAHALPQAHFKKVKGHNVGDPGNTRADMLAKFAAGIRPARPLLPPPPIPKI